MQQPEPIRLGDTRLGPPVFLAPMAGITDLPFRRAVARHGAGLMVSEMVASTEMVTPRPSTRAAIRAKALTEGALPVSVQIAGREAGPMAETARIVEGMGAAIIDIIGRNRVILFSSRFSVISFEVSSRETPRRRIVGRGAAENGSRMPGRLGVQRKVALSPNRKTRNSSPHLDHRIPMVPICHRV